MKNPLTWFRRKSTRVAPAEAVIEVLPPAGSHADLVAEAMRIRAEVREKLGEDTLRKLYRLTTGKDLPRE